MPRARKHLVCVAETPYYLITSRCVRRAFLCGIDHQTGNSYEHRRRWIEDRIRVLSSLFSIDICAYSVMSNHYHLVVKLNTDEPNAWSDDEVLKRWTALFRGPLLVQRYRENQTLTPAEMDTVASTAAALRARLASLSWFMKCLNEPIARQANAEDDCTGHFWEARFHSQALVSERALLTAMAYTDLNPIRAGIATTPEDSDYTSVQARITGRYRANTLAGAITRMLKSGELNHFDAPVRPLLSFAENLQHEPQTESNTGLPMQLKDYLALLDASGRILVHGKRGRIDPSIEPILQRLQLSAPDWARATTAFRKHHWNGDLRLNRPA